MAEEKINLIAIIEMLGRPADYAKQVMKQLIKQLEKEEGIFVVNKKISTPKLVENNKIYSLFAEVEMNIESVRELLLIIFKYIPSHIDIITPENLKIKNNDLNLFANELIKKLHQYDEIAKAVTIERNMLREQLQKLGEKPVALFQQEQKQTKKRKTKSTKKKK